LYYIVSEHAATNESHEHNALCLTRVEDVDNSDVATWCQSAYDVVLPICTANPAKKQIDLRDDHGKDVLIAFAHRIVMSPYVIEVVNSLPFRPEASRFIEHINVNAGIIHLRLHRGDKGLGLAVRVTGKTRDQLERIARLLSDKYDR